MRFAGISQLADFEYHRYMMSKSSVLILSKDLVGSEDNNIQTNRGESRSKIAADFCEEDNSEPLAQSSISKNLQVTPQPLAFEETTTLNQHPTSDLAISWNYKSCSSKARKDTF